MLYLFIMELGCQRLFEVLLSFVVFFASTKDSQFVDLGLIRQVGLIPDFDDFFQISLYAQIDLVRVNLFICLRWIVAG